MKKYISALAFALVITSGAVNVSAETYEVEKGDNLWQVAEKYDTTVEKLMDINDLKTTVIHPKQILLVNETYTVQQGDTLEFIAEKYETTVEDIKKWNNLTSDLVVIGQELKINSIQTEKQVSHSNGEKNNKDTAGVNKKKTTETGEKPNANETALAMTATAYTADCAGCSGKTYTGVDLKKNPEKKVIAVDPNVIPLGSKVHVEGYGYATAEDIGSDIKGNRIDVFISSKKEAKSWGKQTVQVKVMK